MVKIFLILSFFTSSIFAQFTPTNGPSGSNISSIYKNGDYLYALSTRYNLFRHSENEWNRIASNVYAAKLLSFKNNLYSIGSNGVGVSTDNGETWNETDITKYSTLGKEIDSTLYIVVQDTIYHSTDGFSWELSFDSLKVDNSLGNEFTERLIGINDIYIKNDTIFLACNSELFIDEQGIFYSTNNGSSWNRTNGLPQFSYVFQIEEYKGKLYCATSEGIFISEDNGINWSEFNNGFSENSRRVDNILIVNDKLFAIKNYPSDLFVFENNTWIKLTDDAGINHAIEFEDNILFANYTGGLRHYNISSNEISDFDTALNASNSFVFAVNDETVIAYSPSYKPKLTNNGGENWTSIDIEIKSITKMADELFFINSTGVYKTTELGGNVEQIITNIPSNFVNSINSITSADSILYIGFNKTRRRDHLPAVWEAGGIYKSTNKGQTWFNSSSGIASQGNIKAPVSSLTAAGSLLITKTAAGIYRSTDNGSSWTEFSNGLGENESINHIISSGNKIIASSFYSIYYTDESLSTWIEIKEGLPSNSQFYIYHFVEHNGNVYTYINSEQQFYILEENVWEPIGLKQHDYFLPQGFSSTDNIIYAAVIDGGIWKGKIEISTNLNEEINVNKFLLKQNYPNPFNPVTTIKYSIPANVETSYMTSLRVYDVLGNEVAELVNEQKSAGSYEVTFDASNLSSGVYFYTLNAGTFKQVKKMMLIK